MLSPKSEEFDDDDEEEDEKEDSEEDEDFEDEDEEEEEELVLTNKVNKQRTAMKSDEGAKVIKQLFKVRVVPRVVGSKRAQNVRS